MFRSSYPHRPFSDNSQPYFNPYKSHSISASNYPTAFEVYAKPKQPVSSMADSDSAAASTHQARQTLLYYFQDHNGELDLDKILTTAGQVADTVQQISPMIKQAGDILNRSGDS
ncbi:hypothetical protein GCM10007063_11790 [Lentibacillus kapialis]|uniref:Spore coat protein n=1 Tax=Lentibacillus kapialis TaxID=340214 RepID=A0A917PTA9_9BACI|nr:YppG family protein [Lentibacillus kapialis]GGJ90788.1 hypothetical protein GCM10007063_11790 [Lentibacillus kapialis]